MLLERGEKDEGSSSISLSQKAGMTWHDVRVMATKLRDGSGARGGCGVDTERAQVKPGEDGGGEIVASEPALHKSCAIVDDQRF